MNASDFERRLKRAVGVEVPAEILSGDLLRRAIEGAAPARRSPGRAYALAANILLAVTVGFSGGALWTGRTESLEQAVISELAQVGTTRAGTMRAMEPAELRSVLEPAGLHLEGLSAGLESARLCAIKDKVAVHVVAVDASGAVDAFYMPGQLVSNRSEFAYRGRTARLVPLPGGSLAVVSEPNAPLDAIERRLTSVIKIRARI